DSADCHSAKARSVTHHQPAKMRTAESMGLLQNGFEYRREIAGRRVDDLDHLGHRRLSRERGVTVGSARLKLSGALGKLTPKISYDPLGIGQCAIRRRAHLRTSSRPSFRRSHTLKGTLHHEPSWRGDEYSFALKPRVE